MVFMPFSPSNHAQLIYSGSLAYASRAGAEIGEVPPALLLLRLPRFSTPDHFDCAVGALWQR